MSMVGPASRQAATTDRSGASIKSSKDHHTFCYYCMIVLVDFFLFPTLFLSYLCTQEQLLLLQERILNAFFFCAGTLGNSDFEQGRFKA